MARCAGIGFMVVLKNFWLSSLTENDGAWLLQFFDSFRTNQFSLFKLFPRISSYFIHMGLTVPCFYVISCICVLVLNQELQVIVGVWLIHEINSKMFRLSLFHGFHKRKERGNETIIFLSLFSHGIHKTKKPISNGIQEKSVII